MVLGDSMCISICRTGLAAGAGRNLPWSPVAGKQLGCFQSPCLRLLSERQSKGLSRSEPCLAVHREPSSSLFSKEQHDRLLVLYPSTLVIVSEERNSLCFKVSSAWSTFLLSPTHPQWLFQHFFGLLLPSTWVPLRSLCWQGLSLHAAPLPAGR